MKRKLVFIGIFAGVIVVASYYLSLENRTAVERDSSPEQRKLALVHPVKEPATRGPKAMASQSAKMDQSSAGSPTADFQEELMVALAPPPGSRKNEELWELVRRWVRADPISAVSFLWALDEREPARTALNKLAFQEWLTMDADSAVAYAKGKLLTDENVRLLYLGPIFDNILAHEKFPYDKTMALVRELPTTPDFAQLFVIGSILAMGRDPTGMRMLIPALPYSQTIKSELYGSLGVAEAARGGLKALDEIIIDVPQSLSAASISAELQAAIEILIGRHYSPTEETVGVARWILARNDMPSLDKSRSRLTEQLSYDYPDVARMIAAHITNAGLRSKAEDQIIRATKDPKSRPNVY